MLLMFRCLTVGYLGLMDQRLCIIQRIADLQSAKFFLKFLHLNGKRLRLTDHSTRLTISKYLKLGVDCSSVDSSVRGLARHFPACHHLLAEVDDDIQRDD